MTRISKGAKAMHAPYGRLSRVANAQSAPTPSVLSDATYKTDDLITLRTGAGALGPARCFLV